MLRRWGQIKICGEEGLEADSETHNSSPAMDQRGLAEAVRSWNCQQFGGLVYPENQLVRRGSGREEKGRVEAERAFWGRVLGERKGMRGTGVSLSRHRRCISPGFWWWGGGVWRRR
nr:hypothetical protein Itr_chr13CG07710 [Ipomoea trifida]